MSRSEYNTGSKVRTSSKFDGERKIKTGSEYGFNSKDDKNLILDNLDEMSNDELRLVAKHYGISASGKNATNKALKRNIRKQLKEQKTSNNDMNFIEKESLKYDTPREFSKDFTQEGTRDVSNYNDRFGRLFYNNDSLDKLEKDKHFRENLNYHKDANKYNKIIDNNSTSIEIYRAVPKDAPDDIKFGDWVTLDKGYAEEHAKRSLDDGKVISMKVKKKDIISESGDINEWIYSPEAIREEYKSLDNIWYSKASPKRVKKAEELEKKYSAKLEADREEAINKSIQGSIQYKEINSLYEDSKSEPDKVKRLEMLFEAQDRLSNSTVDPHKKSRLKQQIATDKVEIKRELRKEGYTSKDFTDIEDRVFERIDGG